MCTLTLHLEVLQTVIVFWEGSILSRCFVSFGFENSFLCWKMAKTPDSYNLVVEKCNKTIRASFSMILFVFQNCSAVVRRFRSLYAALVIVREMPPAKSSMPVLNGLPIRLCLVAFSRNIAVEVKG